VLALAAGIVEGLDLGHNAMAALVAQARGAARLLRGTSCCSLSVQQGAGLGERGSRRWKVLCDSAGKAFSSARRTMLVPRPRRVTARSTRGR